MLLKGSEQKTYSIKLIGKKLRVKSFYTAITLYNNKCTTNNQNKKIFKCEEIKNDLTTSEGR